MLNVCNRRIAGYLLVGSISKRPLAECKFRLLCRSISLQHRFNRDIQSRPAAPNLESLIPFPFSFCYWHVIHLVIFHETMIPSRSRNSSRANCRDEIITTFIDAEEDRRRSIGRVRRENIESYRDRIRDPRVLFSRYSAPRESSGSLCSRSLIKS